jgi:hypothetical protein
MSIAYGCASFVNTSTGYPVFYNWVLAPYHCQRMLTFPPGLSEELHLTMQLCHAQVFFGGFFVGINQSLAMRF